MTGATREAAPAGSPWIYAEALEPLHAHYGAALTEVRVSRIVVGVFVTAVRLSNGYGGVAFTSPEIVRAAGCDILRGRTPSVAGMRAADIVSGADVGPFAPIVRLATLNALSAPVLAESPVLASSDETTLFSPLVAGRRVCMVGAMIPLIKRLEPLGWSAMLVADRKQETLRQVTGALPIALEDLPAALATCQTLICTGATIPNGSLDDLLGHLSPQTAVVVVGPTAGFVPVPLFSRGVALVSTTLVTDAERALDIVAEGGGMYHLFSGCLGKINVPNVARMRQLGLQAAWA